MCMGGEVGCCNAGMLGCVRGGVVVAVCSVLVARRSGLGSRSEVLRACDIEFCEGKRELA
jgi:hypothetical protein